MKNTTLMLVATLGATLNAFGQPLYDQSNAPMIGTTFPHTALGLMFDPPNLPDFGTGADQTWDLSFLEPINDPTATFVAPASPIHPTATIACTDCPSPYGGLASVAGPLTEYFLSDANGLHLVGSYATSFDVGYFQEVYSNPKTIIKYPTIYGETWSDDYEGVFSGQGAPSNFAGITGEWTADGYGTLVLPSGTISNVLKIHLESVQSNVVDGVVHETVTTFDDFLKPGFGYFVLRVYKSAQYTDGALVSSQPGFPDAITDASVGIGGEPASSIGIEAYPQAGGRSLVIVFGASGRATVELYDVMGRRLRSMDAGELAPGIHRREIDVDGFAAGQYTVVVRMSDGQRGTKKVFINP